MQAEFIEIGEIVRPQGVRGEVKLRAMSEDMNRYAKLEMIYLGEEHRPVKVLKGRANAGFAYLQLEGVADREQAEALRGTSVYVDREHAIHLGEDENFVCEMIGLNVQDSAGNGVGKLVDVLKPNKICDVYVLDTPRGEMMFPALKRVVLNVDVAAGKMTVDANALSEVASWSDEPCQPDE